MKNQIVASIAAIPFALGTVFAGTGAANAVEGSYQLSGTNLFEFDPFESLGLSSATLSNNSLTFQPEPTSAVGLTGQKGDFLDFDFAKIQDIITFTPFVAENPFMDLGTLAPDGPTPDNASINDGENVFNLTNASYQLYDIDSTKVGLDVVLKGNFNIGGETTKGEGVLTLQLIDINGITADQVKNTLAQGGSYDQIALSGAVFTASTPEPTALFGLGVVATGLVASRRKKNS